VILKYIVLVMLFMSISSNVWASQPTIGYGSSDAVLPAKNQELYYLGFEAGLSRKLGDDQWSKYVTTYQISDGSPLGAIKSVKELIGRGVKIIAGFPTSHEAVLVGELASKKGILTISPSAGHSKLAEMGGTVYTTGESIRITVDTVVALANSIINKSDYGLIVYNPRAVFSVDQEEELRRQVDSGGYRDFKVDKTYLLPDLKLENRVLDDLRKEKYKYLIITMYPDESVELMKQLDDNGIEVPIVTNSSWSAGDIEFVRRIIAHRKSPIYGYTLWLENSPAARDISRYIASKYGRKPTMQIVDGYDLGIIVGTLIQRMNADHSHADPTKLFTDDLCFSGTSAGKMCFPSGGGHAKRRVYKVKISKDGWVQMK
jgi:ABC-type branched-subunit amino acid transport system substrate-binding protein